VKKTISKFRKPMAKRLLPVRRFEDNKASAGRCLIVAGSDGMFGAAILAATAAARVGVGYVTLLTQAQKFPTFKSPDFLLMDLKKIKILKNTFSAVAIGPGLGRTTSALNALKYLLKSKIQNVVVDADALNLCAEYRILKFPSTWILTPHEGELARLLNVSSEKIRQNRREYVWKAHQKMGCVVVLKGYKTLVACDQKIYEIQSGNPALAKAGTGDVLTGMITGFLAQGLTSDQAACLGAYVHGKVADDWLKDKKDVLSLMASDLLNLLPRTMAQIRGGSSAALFKG